MQRVLIVDDEEVYRRQLETALTGEGHEVQTAASGRQAIDVGARSRPDVLITDWMLKDDIHGIHVAHVLRAVFGDLQTVLITGFPSEDLVAEADRAHLLAFLQKPFGLEQIRQALDRAEEAPSPARLATLAVMEVGGGGAILSANERARSLFAQTTAGPEAATLAALFAAEPPPDLDQAVGRWMALAPRTRRQMLWRVRAGAPDDRRSRLVVLLDRDEPRYTQLPLIEMLLGIRDREVRHWTLDGRVLILDGAQINRHWLVSMLEGVGAGCYAVGTPSEAARLLETDDGIRFVVMDEGPAGEDLTARVDGLLAVRDDTIIVGSSDDDARDRFTAAGVELFLRRPWRAEDLIWTLNEWLNRC